MSIVCAAIPSNAAESTPSTYGPTGEPGSAARTDPNQMFASTNGVDRSTRRPDDLSIFSTRSRTSSAVRTVVVSSCTPRRAMKTVVGSLTQAKTKGGRHCARGCADDTRGLENAYRADGRVARREAQPSHALHLWHQMYQRGKVELANYDRDHRRLDRVADCPL